MKCVVLTGGYGERMWPLSRKNYPKQFVNFKNNHSIFQDTIARNIPYCDEFIIVSNYEYRNIIKNQLEPFQGLNYTCLYEKERHNTASALTLACLNLDESELVFVTSTNLEIESDNYDQAILEGKKIAKSGSIAILVDNEKTSSKQYGYATKIEGDSVISYIEKPEKELHNVYKNLGFLFFENGVFLRELSKDILDNCKMAHKNRCFEDGDIVCDSFEVRSISIEKELLEKSSIIKAVKAKFVYKYIRSIEDIDDYVNKGVIVSNQNANNKIINTDKDKAVVILGAENLTVINTKDALLIGNDLKSLKDVLKSPELQRFCEKSSIFYRNWGYYENLVCENNYRVRRLSLRHGKTIYEHEHRHRTESWTVLTGTAKVSMDGSISIYSTGDHFCALPLIKHQISNVGLDALEMIEVSIGDIGDDTYSTTDKNINEIELGIEHDPIIKLRPALKNYIWGGNRFVTEFGFESDFDIIAEMWVLSAHPDGESVVSSGKHKGMKFSNYIETVGKNILGWKCSSLQKFPLLVKLIDAKENLSIQVHPNDDYALENENQYGKNEVWYVVDSEPGAGLYIGFNKDVTKDEVIRGVSNGTIADILNFFPTKKGDLFMIPSGTVHAICKGNLICEVQQSSNCTYRLYDYKRKDKYGQERELHIDKALDVLNYQKYIPDTKDSVLCKYFKIEVIDVNGSKDIVMENDCFMSICCVDGTGTASLNDYTVDVKKGDNIFVPSNYGVLALSGVMRIVISHV